MLLSSVTLPALKLAMHKNYSASPTRAEESVPHSPSTSSTADESTRCKRTAVLCATQHTHPKVMRSSRRARQNHEVATSLLA